MSIYRLPHETPKDRPNLYTEDCLNLIVEECLQDRVQEIRTAIRDHFRALGAVAIGESFLKNIGLVL